MQDVSPVNIDLIPLANVLGIIYQIQDDYLNLQSKTVSIVVIVGIKTN